jgi:hypothetical protein
VLDEAIEQVPVSFRALAPLADYSAQLSNDDDDAPPVFLPPDTLESFAEVWRDLAAAEAPPRREELPNPGVLRSESEAYAAMMAAAASAPAAAAAAAGGGGGGAGAVPAAAAAGEGKGGGGGGGAGGGV